MTALRIFHPVELDAATNNFSEENVIGKGGSATIYKVTFRILVLLNIFHMLIFLIKLILCFSNYVIVYVNLIVVMPFYTIVFLEL